MTRLHLNRGQIQSLAIISLLISVTVALPLTTAPVRALSVQTRGLTLMLTAISVAFLIFSARGNRIALFSTITFALFYLYGMLMAAIMGGISSAMGDLQITVLLTFLGLFVVSQRPFVVPRGNAVILVFYVIAFLLATILFGGLVLSMPPHFVFQVQSDTHGSNVSYSQGVSKFFRPRLGCLCLSLAVRDQKYRSLLLALSLLFLILAFLGGGRGDALAAFFIFLFIVAVRLPLRAKIPTIILSALVLGVFLLNINLDDLVIFRRLSIILELSAGARDAIYADAIALLADRTQCAFIGCGFNFFQHALHLDAGVYPHNQILEAIIVWGAPLTLGLIAFCSFGLYISLREKGKYDAFPFITLYFIILAMKSGSLVSSWLFVIGVFHYFGVGLDRALFPRKV